jgi:predicted esterase YcpF (UPF0227 family)
MEEILPDHILYEGEINEHLPIEQWFINRDPAKEPLDYIIEDHNTDSLIVSFGGSGYDQNGEAQYSLLKFLEKEKISTIFLRDQANCWYFAGVRGLSKDVQSTVSGLNNLISNIRHKKTIFIGVSAGGFAALLYGILCNADLVTAINPQTLLQKNVQCFAHGNLYKLKWCNQEDMIYRNIKNINSFNKTKIEIYYGKDDPIDVFHSGRMENFYNTTLYAVEGTHSTTAVEIRDNGMLKYILDIKKEI